MGPQQMVLRPYFWLSPQGTLLVGSGDIYGAGDYTLKSFFLETERSLKTLEATTRMQEAGAHALRGEAPSPTPDITCPPGLQEEQSPSTKAGRAPYHRQVWPPSKNKTKKTSTERMSDDGQLPQLLFTVSSHGRKGEEFSGPPSLGHKLLSQGLYPCDLVTFQSPTSTYQLFGDLITTHGFSRTQTCSP